MTQRAIMIPAGLAGTLIAGLATAGADDTSRFNLVNPTPRQQMREMSTDRPDTTESPYTVDAGHAQVELSFLDYTRDDSSEGDFEALSILPTNFKIGLLNNADIQFVVEPHVREKIDTDVDEGNISGFGATQVRFKLNLWGNDGGKSALALMPFVQLPTADDDFGATDCVEGGLIVPLAISLPQGWGLGLMAEIDLVRDEADAGYGTQFVHTAAVGHDIAGDLAGYIEYIGVASHDLELGYVALLGGGLTYGLSDDMQLDGGINVGVSDDADDFNAFVGLSVRQ
jgi:hypothetical protein